MVLKRVIWASVFDTKNCASAHKSQHGPVSFSVPQMSLFQPLFCYVTSTSCFAPSLCCIFSSSFCYQLLSCLSFLAWFIFYPYLIIIGCNFPPMLHTFSWQEDKMQKQEVCSKPVTPSSTRLLCSFKWNQMGPLASSQVSHRGCLKLDNGLLVNRRRDFPLTLCCPLVSPHTSSVSMQSSSSNSSRDAHGKNWSARGSCHVSLCIQSSENSHPQPVFHCDTGLLIDTPPPQDKY